MPVLVAMREPMTVPQLAWACEQPEDTIDLALRLLGGLFRRVGTEPQLVQPYHKSVIDWLKGEEDMDAGQFRADVVVGHMLLGEAGARHASSMPRSPRMDSYALAHTVPHLCEMLHTDLSKSASALLDELLSNWEFLESVCLRSGCAASASSALATAGTSELLSKYAYDAMRWIRRILPELGHNVTCIAGRTYSLCPPKSTKYQEAALREDFVPTILELGGEFGDWGAMLMALKVRGLVPYRVNVAGGDVRLCVSTLLLTYATMSRAEPPWRPGLF